MRFKPGETGFVYVEEIYDSTKAIFGVHPDEERKILVKAVEEKNQDPDHDSKQIWVEDWENKITQYVPQRCFIPACHEHRVEKMYSEKDGLFCPFCQ